MCEPLDDDALVNRVFEIDRGEMRTYEGDYDYHLTKSGREAWVA